MILDKNAAFNEANRKRISDFYREYVRTEMLDVWASRTADEEYGGYITDFDRAWGIRSYNKGAWGQGRHVYTFSAAYAMFGDEKWLRLAKLGKEFTLKKMYAGNGRFNYLVDRAGTGVLDGTISISSDAFIIGGLARYIAATGGDDGDAALLEELFAHYAANVRDDGFRDVAPFAYADGVCSHAKYMLGVNVAHEAGKVLGRSADALARFCTDRILGTLYDEKSGLILEKMRTDGSRCDGADALLVNTGHIFESLWFCLEAALARGDDTVLKRAVRIAETNYRRSRGWDGHSVYAYNADGGASNFGTWKYEVAFDDADKVSWSYVEEMYLWALLASATGDRKYFGRFIDVHNFTQERFVDREYRDWYHALDANNRVICDFKGSTVKSAYHMPRAMMRLSELFAK